jgi:hypothetical protein
MGCDKAHESSTHAIRQDVVQGIVLIITTGIRLNPGSSQVGIGFVRSPFLSAPYMNLAVPIVHVLVFYPPWNARSAIIIGLQGRAATMVLGGATLALSASGQATGIGQYQAGA